MDTVTAAVIANRGIRCGNHGTAKVYHADIAEVRECCRPAAPEPKERKSSGWWNLPIAASMWAADGRDLHA